MFLECNCSCENVLQRNIYNRKEEGTSFCHMKLSKGMKTSIMKSKKKERKLHWKMITKVAGTRL